MSTTTIRFIDLTGHFGRRTVEIPVRDGEADTQEASRAAAKAYGRGARFIPADWRTRTGQIVRGSNDTATVLVSKVRVDYP